jgi:hypothetical protein
MTASQTIKERVVPDKWSLLGMYGNKDIFKQKLKEGYTEVAFGGGKWNKGYRIVALYVFRKPGKKLFWRFRTSSVIATYEHPKFQLDYYTMHGKPFEARYTERSFKKYTEKHLITISSFTDLATLLSTWA